MAGLVRKSFDAPEETRPFDGNTGHLEFGARSEHRFAGRG